MGAVTYPTLEHVAQEARPYPAHLLEGCKTGLVLFAAAFLGHNDAVHMAEAGFRCVWCVDTDGDKLAQMQALYPDNWFFLNEDAWDYASTCKERYHGLGSWTQFDVVSVDTFTGDVMRRSLDSLELWCSLARKVVTVTYTAGEPFTPPEGWTHSLYHRSALVYWLVLTRET